MQSQLLKVGKPLTFPLYYLSLQFYSEGSGGGRHTWRKWHLEEITGKLWEIIYLEDLCYHLHCSKLHVLEQSLLVSSASFQPCLDPEVFLTYLSVFLVSQPSSVLGYRSTLSPTSQRWCIKKCNTSRPSRLLYPIFQWSGLVWSSTLSLVSS